MTRVHTFILVSYTSSLLFIYSASRGFVTHTLTRSPTGLMSLPPFHPLVELYNIKDYPMAKDFIMSCDVTALPHSYITTTTMLLSRERIQTYPLTFYPLLRPLSLAPYFLPSPLWFGEFVQMGQQQVKGARAKVPPFDLNAAGHAAH